MSETVEILISYLSSHPEVASAIAVLLSSFGVGLSNLGGERFVMAKKLYRLISPAKN